MAAQDSAGGRLARFWRTLHGRPSTEEAHLYLRVDATKSFLKARLDEPLIAERVTTALRAQHVHASKMDLTKEEVLSRLRRALNGGLEIRSATPTENWLFEGRFDAVAVRYIFSRRRMVLFSSSTLSRLSPAELSVILLHELVHAEFGLGEHSAYFVGLAYFARLRGRFPDVFEGNAANVARLADRLHHGTLSDWILQGYGEKNLSHNDDLLARAKVVKRGKARVNAVIGDMAQMVADGTWDLVWDKRGWIDDRLTRAEERRSFYELVGNSELASALPRSYAGAAAAPAP